MRHVQGCRLVDWSHFDSYSGQVLLLSHRAGHSPFANVYWDRRHKFAQRLSDIWVYHLDQKYLSAHAFGLIYAWDASISIPKSLVYFLVVFSANRKPFFNENSTLETASNSPGILPIWIRSSHCNCRWNSCKVGNALCRLRVAKELAQRSSLTLSDIILDWDNHLIYDSF